MSVSVAWLWIIPLIFGWYVIGTERSTRVFEQIFHQSTPKLPNDLSYPSDYGNEESEMEQRSSSRVRDSLAFCLAVLLNTGTVLLASVIAYVAPSIKYRHVSLVFACNFAGSFASGALMILSTLLLKYRSKSPRTRLLAAAAVLTRVLGKTMAYFNGVAFIAHCLLISLGWYEYSGATSFDLNEYGGIMDLARIKWMLLILLSVLIVGAFTGVVISGGKMASSSEKYWRSSTDYTGRLKAPCLVNTHSL